MSAPPLGPDEAAHLVRAIEQHITTCDCPAAPGRHPAHSRRSRSSLVDEALYDVAQLDAPPANARIVCFECGTEHATVGDYTRAMHELTAHAGVPAHAWTGQCARCPKDVEITP